MKGRYSIATGKPRYVKGYRFLSFAKNNIPYKNVSRPRI